MKKYSSYTIILFLMLLLLNNITAQHRLNIMTYNIHHGNDDKEVNQLRAIADLILKSGADIVGLQEVDSVCIRSGRVDQAKALAELTGMHYAYVRHFAFEGGSYGLALLSKYPISKLTNHRLPIASTIPNETRALLTAEVQVSPKKKWLVGVAHFDYRDADSRINQAKQTTSIYKKSGLPGILLGDMNAEPDSEPIAILSKIFQDTQPSDYLTYPANSPIKKIDYIFVDIRQKFRILEKSVLPVNFSDHRPAITIIE